MSIVSMCATVTPVLALTVLIMAVIVAVGITPIATNSISFTISTTSTIISFSVVATVDVACVNQLGLKNINLYLHVSIICEMVNGATSLVDGATISFNLL